MGGVGRPGPYRRLRFVYAKRFQLSSLDRQPAKMKHDVFIVPAAFSFSSLFHRNIIGMAAK